MMPTITIDQMKQQMEDRKRESRAKNSGGNSPTKEASGLFPCPLCDVPLPLKLDKNGNPYCICNYCGVQLFVRFRAGQVRLLKRLITYDQSGEGVDTPTGNIVDCN